MADGTVQFVIQIVCGAQVQRVDTVTLLLDIEEVAEPLTFLKIKPNGVLYKKNGQTHLQKKTYQ